MAIASYKPTAAPVPSVVDPAMLVDKKDVYHTASVDNAVIAPSSLLVNLEGMPWSVDYYSQLIDSCDDIREIDIGQNAALQQYQLTKGLELRVQSELSSSYDSSSALTTVNGTSIVVQVVPVKYDYFVTDVGDREKGLFMVTSVEQKTYNNKTVHEINYVLIGYLTSTACKDRWEALEARTVRTFFFHKERIGEGASPLLTLSEHYNAENLKIAIHAILESYFSTFLCLSEKILFVPTGPDRLVDSRLINFISETISVREAPALQYMNTFPVDKDPYLSKASLWPALLTKQWFLLKTSLNKLKCMPRSFFASNAAFMTGAAAWGIDRYIYPDFGDDNKARVVCSTSRHPVHDPRALLEELEEDVLSREYCTELSNYIDGASGPVPVIKPVHSDGYYVFSEAFYKGESDLSVLEVLVRDMLNNKVVSMEQVVIVANKYVEWPPMEKFYYGPVLLVLIRDVVRGYY